MQRIGSFSRLQWLTTASLVLIGSSMLLLSRGFSMSGDELAQMQTGHNVYAFLGRLLGLLPADTVIARLDNYGALFGVVSTGIARLLPAADELHVRHFLIAVMGFFTIFYAGRTAHLLHGRAAALICIWMLACSPRFFGASMNNSKDIPFALGMTMATYFLLRIIRDAPVIARLHFAGLFTGLFIAIGVRIGGLMFGIYAALAFIYLAWRFWRPARVYVLHLAGWLVGTGLAAFLAAIVFLPFVWYNIPLGTLKALHTFSHYRVALTMLYAGKDLPTWEPPWHYLPVWIGITVPVTVLLLLLFAPLLLRRERKFPLLLLAFTAVFPWLSIIIAHSPVYDGWRQFYFIYPAMAVLAATAGASCLSLLKNNWQRYIVSGLVVAGLLLPLMWSIRNHPLESVYFNELIGGVSGAYGRFETDYYGESVEIAVGKLLQQPAFRRPLKDSVYVVDNVPSQLIYYLKMYDPRISCRHIMYERRDQYRWDYGVFYTRPLDTLLHRSDWPPPGLIDSVVADHTLLMVIVRQNVRETVR